MAVGCVFWFPPLICWHKEPQMRKKQIRVSWQIGFFEMMERENSGSSYSNLPTGSILGTPKNGVFFRKGKWDPPWFWGKSGLGELNLWIWPDVEVDYHLGCARISQATFGKWKFRLGSVTETCFESIESIYPYLDVIFGWRFLSESNKLQIEILWMRLVFLPVDVSSLGCKPHL